MQRKRICYIITKSNFGGAQKYVYELATSLDITQFDVTVALGGNGPLKTKLEAAHIKVISIPHLERNVSLLKEVRVFAFLYTFFTKEQFDIVHLNSSKIGGIGSFAARLARIKVIIFTAHGWAFNEQRSFISKLLIKISYWITLCFTHKTIAVSEAIKNQVQHWPFISKKINVIRNGVKPITFLDQSDARVALSNTYPQLNIHTKWIGTLAELHHIKGIDVLIDAAEILLSKHTSIQFVVMGEGEFRSVLEKKIRDKNMTNQFVLLGHVDAAPQFLKAFELFVLPSRSEALALVILEAALAEVPIVATSVGGIPEVIFDTSVGLLIPPQDSHALAETIETSLQDNAQAKERAIRLQSHVEKAFSHQKMIVETIDLYTD